MVEDRWQLGEEGLDVAMVIATMLEDLSIAKKTSWRVFEIGRVVVACCDWL
jgi:hypothetical protein